MEKFSPFFSYVDVLSFFEVIFIINSLSSNESIIALSFVNEISSSFCTHLTFGSFMSFCFRNKISENRYISLWSIFDELKALKSYFLKMIYYFKIHFIKVLIWHTNFQYLKITSCHLLFIISTLILNLKFKLVKDFYLCWIPIFTYIYYF